MPGKTRERNAPVTHPQYARLGSANPASKLKEPQVRNIRERYQKGGILQRDLADEYGVSQHVIHLIVSGKTWKNI